MNSVRGYVQSFSINHQMSNLVEVNIRLVVTNSTGNPMDITKDGSEVIIHAVNETTARPLHTLNRQEYAILQTWGFLKEFYPSCTGDWAKDSAAPVEHNPYAQIKLPRAQMVGTAIAPIGGSLGGYATMKVNL